jgi:hypothetical protein
MPAIAMISAISAACVRRDMVFVFIGNISDC